MMRMGIAMSVSNILTVVSAYILRSYLRYEGGIEEVGIFSAGYAIINTYVNMIFTAMSTDFYPRLAAVNRDNAKCRDIVNQQGEIGTLIIAPMLMCCITFMPILINLLYSEKFVAANDYVLFAAVGMMFRFASVLVAHLFLAKGSAKIYMQNEAAVCIYTLALNLAGFHYLGLKDLGISFMLSYLLYLIQVLWQSRKYYDFYFSKSFTSLYVFHLLMVLLCLCTFLFTTGALSYCIGIPFCVVSIVSAIIGLDKRIKLIETVKSRFFRL